MCSKTEKRLRNPLTQSINTPFSAPSRPHSWPCPLGTHGARAHDGAHEGCGRRTRALPMKAERALGAARGPACYCRVVNRCLRVILHVSLVSTLRPGAMMRVLLSTSVSLDDSGRGKHKGLFMPVCLASLAAGTGTRALYINRSTTQGVPRIPLFLILATNQRTKKDEEATENKHMERRQGEGIFFFFLDHFTN